MGSLQAELFVEDRAHEEFCKAIVYRLCREENRRVTLIVRSARGGHGRALTEFSLYQRALEKGLLHVPGMLIVAIDANCQRFAAMRQEISARIIPNLRDCTAIACPDPHVERWYMADSLSFATVVGVSPKVGRKKCARGYYKKALVDTVRQAGHIPTLGGIEFARELVEDMDLYRAAKNDHALRAFIDETRAIIRRV
jgi:hypothetical protein